MLFSTPLKGPRGKLARDLSRAGWISISCGAAAFLLVGVCIATAVSDFNMIWPLLIGVALLMLGATLLFCPMMLLAVPPAETDPMVCKRCGYSLVGLAEPRCLECGQPIGMDPRP